MTQGVAIVGMACRFADASSPAELWQTVLAQRRAFRRLPPERMRLADYDDRAGADGTYVREAAVLQNYEFDRVRFRVSGEAYRSADLTHWLALEVAANALVDAGFTDGSAMPRDRTRVIVGNTLTGEFARAQLMRLRWPFVRGVVDEQLAGDGWDQAARLAFLQSLERRYKSPFPVPDSESLAGGMSNTIAGRICNHFDLRGGGFCVDGACASSLLAVAQACSALDSGDADLAIVGGVDLSLDPFELVGFARVGALAHGDMRVFDASPTGFLPGEGCGFVVLQREEDAARERRRRYAIIRGWGISSDGGGGLTRPESSGQLLAIQRAYERAGFDASSVEYFEGHGTGTAAGDAAELSALIAALEASQRTPRRAAVVGSIKACIGHTKAAAGAAGLIKAAMAVREQVIPPTTACVTAHPLLGANAPLRTSDVAAPWPADGALRAGVSAMGFGGINTHVAIEGDEPRRRRALTAVERRATTSPQASELFVLSATDRASFAARCDTLAARASRLARCELADASAALARAETRDPVRGAIVARTPGALADGLAQLATAARRGETFADASRGLWLGERTHDARIGFLFPGQGAPSRPSGGAWRERFDSINSWYEAAALAGADGDVATEVAQPAIVAASVAALDALASLGIQANVAVGHSLGELSALCWAGALSRESALRIARGRGRVMAELSESGGGMVAIAASAADVGPIIAGTSAVIGATNSPRQVVVSGCADALREVTARASDRRWRVQALRTSHAFHSQMVAPAAEPLRGLLEREVWSALDRRVVSSVTGRHVATPMEARRLLIEQVTSPVLFFEAVVAAHENIELWIEVGPGRTLTSLFDAAWSAPAVALDCCAGSFDGLLESVAWAHVKGADVNAGALFEGRFTRFFDLEREQVFLANPCSTMREPSFEETPIAPAVAQSTTSQPVNEVATVERDETDIPTLVRQLVADRCELPLNAVSAEQGLLRDLHLNSIMVAELASEAAQRIGLAPSGAPTEYSSATVGELSTALERRAATEERVHRDAEDVLAGVDTWIRTFETVFLERPRAAPRPAAGDSEWKVLMAPGDPLAPALQEHLRPAGGRGIVCVLSDDFGRDDLDRFLETARIAAAEAEPYQVVFVQDGGGASAFARTLHLEHPALRVTVVDIERGDAGAAEHIAAETASASGFREVHYNASGVRREPVERVLPTARDDFASRFSSADCILVTGGAKGIGLECAEAIGRASGARIALLGRAPRDEPTVAAPLLRLAAAGIEADYFAANVCDAGAVRTAVRTLESNGWCITAVVHAAGINEPTLLADLDRDALERAFAPKVTGLANVVDALDMRRVRAVVAFGSVIGRSGLRGAAAYALANDAMARYTVRLAAKCPSCRCITIDWSVWAANGMGARLGQVGALARAGVTAITLSMGTDALLRLLAADSTPSRMTVCGRYGNPPQLDFRTSEPPFLRFLENVRVYYPGVEIVADAELSDRDDPYLDDHVFGGQRLLPAVMALEAMAQAALALGASSTPIAFERVEFVQPMVVPADGSLTVRVAALRRESGSIDFALRCSATAFAVDHVRATCPSLSDTTLGRPIAPPAQRDSLFAVPLHHDANELYDEVLFQRGRFRRLRTYEWLDARSCVTSIAPRDGGSWFGAYVPETLLLGDPGARDAALHAIQACVPQLTLLPIGADRIMTSGLSPQGGLRAEALERSRNGRVFTYDMRILDRDGQVLESWDGVRFRVLDVPERVPRIASLLGPYFERRVEELVPGSALAVAVCSNACARKLYRGTRIVRSHAGALTLAVRSNGIAASDVERVRDRSERVWRNLLTAPGFTLASVIATTTNEPLAHCATRVWSSMECLVKAGRPPGTPLTLEDVSGDGWVVLRAGAAHIATFLGSVRGEPCPVAFALLTQSTSNRSPDAAPMSAAM